MMRLPLTRPLRGPSTKRYPTSHLRGTCPPSARAVPAGDVAPLAHETRDDAVEGAPLVVQGRPRVPLARLARAQAAEVLARPGRLPAVEPEDDPPRGLAAHGHVEEGPGRDGQVGLPGQLLLEEVLPLLRRAQLQQGHHERPVPPLLRAVLEGPEALLGAHEPPEVPGQDVRPRD